MGYNAEPGAIGNFPKLRVTINSTGVYSHCTKINLHIWKLLLTLDHEAKWKQWLLYCSVFCFVFSRWKCLVHCSAPRRSQSRLVMARLTFCSANQRMICGRMPG